MKIIWCFTNNTKMFLTFSMVYKAFYLDFQFHNIFSKEFWIFADFQFDWLPPLKYNCNSKYHNTFKWLQQDLNPQLITKLTSLVKRLSVCLRCKWLRFVIPLQLFKVNKLPYEQCGVNQVCTIGQNLLKKTLRKDKYWHNKSRKTFW